VPGGVVAFQERTNSSQGSRVENTGEVRVTAPGSELRAVCQSAKLVIATNLGDAAWLLGLRRGVAQLDRRTVANITIKQGHRIDV